MLIRSTWTLTLSETTVLPRAYGLELIKQLHQQLGIEMGSEIIPPVTYSGILGFCAASKDFLTFEPNQLYSLTVAGLQEKESKAISHLNLSSGLNFLGAKFKVLNREDEISSYEELYTHLVANEPATIPRVNLRFTTPTAFAQSQGIHLPLPLPHLMFRSWLERWNHFAPVYLGSYDLMAYLDQSVALKHHKIKTRTFQLYRGYINGFTGEIVLQILGKTDPLLANVAHLLIRYAEFAGTGIKTRLGMGKTEVTLRTTRNLEPCETH